MEKKDKLPDEKLKDVSGGADNPEGILFPTQSTDDALPTDLHNESRGIAGVDEEAASFQPGPIL